MRNQFTTKNSLIALLLCVGFASKVSTADTKPIAFIQPDARIVSIAAIYFAPEPKGQPEAMARQLLNTKFKLFTARADRKVSGDKPTVFFEYVDLKEADFEPPTVERLKYFGRGVSSEQAQAMQRSKRGLILSFSYSSQETFKALNEVSAFLSELAKTTDGLIWDEDTRELFGIEAWNKKRLEDWVDGVPMAEKFTVIHAYKNTDYIRAITLGMNKFGLPDVVINDFSWSVNRQMGNTINAFSQLLVEGTAVPERGNYDLRVQSIKHSTLHKNLVDSFLDNATGVGKLVVKQAERDEGDPDNRLIELAFDRYTGASLQERQDQFVDEIFGHHDEMTMTRHTGEVLEVSKRAQAKFETYRKRFEKGLEPGEHIMVKSPFKTKTGGNEWMWVEVIKWKGGDITGLLRNDPEMVPGLHAGATVHVKQAEIFDYIRYTADGEEEGNETGPLLQKSAEK